MRPAKAWRAGSKQGQRERRRTDRSSKQREQKEERGEEMGGWEEGCLEALQIQPHTSLTSPHTHKLRCLEQPGSKENNKYSECTHTFFFPYKHTHKHTRRERSARVTVSLTDTGAGVRFGWLKQREMF